MSVDPDDIDSAILKAPARNPNARAERLQRLQRSPNETRNINAGYSKFVKSLKITLPLLALAIIAALFTGNMLNDKQIIPTQNSNTKTAATIGKNELLTPRFDSVDAKNQPFIITADRALQDTDNDQIQLEKPKGTLELNNGKTLTITALDGTYHQENQKVFLKNDVRLTQNDGYEFTTQTLDIDMKANTAHTDKAVQGGGPLGKIKAQGMDANNDTETLIFQGPATLLIFETPQPPIEGSTPNE